jgi:flagellar basal-body rod modification protein FlgD
MSISQLDGVSNLPDPNQQEMAQAAGKMELGKDAFLTLLVAQMSNQDPLNPQSNGEFIAQLSSFTQVEQLMGLNSRFEALYMAMNSVNNTSMTQLLGREVVAYGDEFHYHGEGPIDLHYDAAGEVTNATLTVYDEEGNVVWSGPAGSMSEGEGDISWSGKDHNGNKMEEGTYTFSIDAQDSDGQPVDVAELVVGVVDEMSFIDGLPTPSINGIQFELGSIIRVADPEQES